MLQIPCLESWGQRGCPHLSGLAPELRKWKGEGGRALWALGLPVGLCRTTKRKGLSIMISSGAIRAETVMAGRDGAMS